MTVTMVRAMVIAMVVRVAVGDSRVVVVVEVVIGMGVVVVVVAKPRVRAGAVIVTLPPGVVAVVTIELRASEPLDIMEAVVISADLTVSSPYSDVTITMLMDASTGIILGVSLGIRVDVLVDVNVNVFGGVMTPCEFAMPCPLEEFRC